MRTRYGLVLRNGVLVRLLRLVQASRAEAQPSRGSVVVQTIWGIPASGAALHRQPPVKAHGRLHLFSVPFLKRLDLG